MSNPDYRGPLLELERSLIAAKNLGYTVPLSFEIALKLMRGDVRVPLYSDMGPGMVFGIITDGGDSEEEQEEMFALYIKTAKGKKERRRVAEAIAAFARDAAAPLPVEASDEAGAFEGPTCSSCGGPRSVGSASQCRACYQGARKTATAVPA